MPFPPQGSGGAPGETTDLYEVDGTSGDATAPSSAAAWAEIPEMTKTLDLSAGDKVIMIFEANFWVAGSNYVRLRMQADGAQIAFEGRASNDSAAASNSRTHLRTFVAIYEAVVDGAVVFNVTWKTGIGAGNAKIYGNVRKLILEHIHS
jgi:hypothetical protein